MYLLTICKLKSGWGGLIGFRVVEINFVQWLAHLAPSFSINNHATSPFLYQLLLSRSTVWFTFKATF